MALPKALISREMLKQMNGIQCMRTSIQPANSSGDFTYNPTGNNRVIFQIPSFENSFVNTKRSYIHFKLTTTAANGSSGGDAAQMLLCPGAPVFRRLLLKNSRGQVLSDIDNYDILCRLKNNFKSPTEVQFKEATTFDTRTSTLDSTTNFANGVTIIHELNDGLLGKEQEFLIPVSSMISSSGYAFQLELWLNSKEKVFPMSKTAGTDFSYKITDISFDLELVEVTPEIMKDINEELANGAEIPIPYISYRNHTNHIASGSSYKANISESAHNVNSVYSVLMKQDQGSAVSVSVDTAAKLKKTENDPYRFLGGRKKIDNTGATVDATDGIITKYSYKYGSKYYPLAPVNLIGDSTLALENILSGFELDNHMIPFLALRNYTVSPPISRFETDTFTLAQNFKTTNDNLLNGLNSSANGSPIELNLEFSSTVNNLEVQTFVEQVNHLYIKQNGQSSIIKN